MDLFKRKKSISNSKTVSDENTEMLPSNKQSKSDIITKKTNALLVIIAIGMLGVFIIGAVLSANKNSAEISSTEKGLETAVDKKKLEDVPYLSPVVLFDPDTLKIDNQLVGSEIFKQILVSVSVNPVKFTDISLSFTVEGLILDASDCLSREKVSANSSCSINLTWTPEKKENKSLFIMVKYNELEDNNVVKNADKTAKINMTLQSTEPEPVVAPAPEPAPIQQEQFFDEGYEIDESLAPEEETFFEQTIPQPRTTEKPDDCKKYASKAYDFSGTFIGWVQGNNDVFSPNCSDVIGVMQDDGMVMEIGTGIIIGKGPVMDKKKSEERRIELTLPILDEIMQTTGTPPEPNFEEVMSNRYTLKSSSQPADDYTTLHRIEDTLGIYEEQQKKLIPFTITSSAQVSSMPKDERYVLRQSKPIPAVLNRPIYMSSDTGGSQDVTATVERNVFGGDGRTIIIPSGSQLIGVAQLPDAAGIQAVQKINISWNRLIRPDGAEFDLGAVGNYSADAQGRAGVPGKNDTEYMQQLFIKPLLYSALPVAMEAIFPSTSNLVTRVRRSDGTYNTIAGVANTLDIADGNNDNYSYDWNDTTYQLDMSSKDKIKAEIQQNFKSVMQKLIEDSAKQKIPFTVPSGTRIQVFLNNDIMLRTTDGIDELIDGGNGENWANKYTYGGESEATDIRRTNVNYTFSSDSTDGATTFKDYTTDAGGTAINQGYGADDAYYDDTGDVYDEDTGEVYY